MRLALVVVALLAVFTPALSGTIMDDGDSYGIPASVLPMMTVCASLGANSCGDPCVVDHCVHSRAVHGV